MTVRTYGGPIPKTLLAACEASGMVAEVGNEGEDGYWLYLLPGFYNPDLETTCVHEHTVREAIAALKGCEKGTPLA